MKIEFEGTLAEFRALFDVGNQQDVTSRPPVVPAETEPEEVKAGQRIPCAGCQGEGRVNYFISEDEGYGTRDCSDCGGTGEHRERKLPSISVERRAASWVYFASCCRKWVQGFEEKGVEQPDRVQLIQEMGSGSHMVPILVMAYERASLQALVRDALVAEGINIPSVEWLNRVAAHMVQVSHFGYPDLAGTYDHSSKWKKEFANGV